MGIQVDAVVKESNIQVIEKIVEVAPSKPQMVDSETQTNQS